MRTSAVGFLFRQMHERGIRVRAGHMDMDIPEGANLIEWDTWRHTRLGEPITEATGQICYRLRSEPTGEKMAIAWWIFEHKVGERVDQVTRTVKGEKKTVDKVVELFEPGYREQAGELLTVLDAPGTRWVIEMGITAELRDNNPGGFMSGIERREWLECDVCGDSVCAPKKFGPATANKSCSATPRCHGKIRRLPLVFEVVSPKTIPKRRPKAEGDKPASTPGAERFKKRVTTKTTTKTVSVEEWIADGDVSYEETAADAEAA